MGEIVPLIKLKKGEEAVIQELYSTQERHLHKLTVFGIMPGARIRVLQEFPAYVLRIGYTEIAVDRVLASIIICQK